MNDKIQETKIMKLVSENAWKLLLQLNMFLILIKRIN